MRKYIFIPFVFLIFLLVSCSKYHVSEFIYVKDNYNNETLNYTIEEISNSDISGLIALDDQLEFNINDFTVFKDKYKVLNKIKNENGLFQTDDGYSPFGLLFTEKELIASFNEALNAFIDVLKQKKDALQINELNIEMKNLYGDFFIYGYDGYESKPENSRNQNYFYLDYKTDCIKYLKFFIPDNKVNLDKYISELEDISQNLKIDTYICPCYKINKNKDYYELNFSKIHFEKFDKLYLNTYAFDRGYRGEISFEKINKINPTSINLGNSLKLEKPISFFTYQNTKEQDIYLVVTNKIDFKTKIEISNTSFFTYELLNNLKNRFNYITSPLKINEGILLKLHMKENEKISIRIHSQNNETMFELLTYEDYMLKYEV